MEHFLDQRSTSVFGTNYWHDEICMDFKPAWILDQTWHFYTFLYEINFILEQSWGDTDVFEMFLVERFG